jgi:hypothetical protein
MEQWQLIHGRDCSIKLRLDTMLQENDTWSVTFDSKQA